LPCGSAGTSDVVGVLAKKGTSIRLVKKQGLRFKP